MNRRISLNGSDWLFKDFYGKDWDWRNSHLPDSRDQRHWRVGSVPGCPQYDLSKLGEIPDPYVDRNSLLIEWIRQRTWLYKTTFILGEEIHRMRSQCLYLILEVANQATLATIARAVHAEPVLCGSSAIAEELTAVWGPPRTRHQRQDLPPLTEMGILIVAGSLMAQTAAQIEHLEQKGTPCFILDLLQLFDPPRPEANIASLCAEISTDCV